MTDDGPAGSGSAPRRPEQPGEPHDGPAGSGSAPRRPEQPGEPQGGGPLDPAARRRVALAVRAGEAVADPAEAPAAVELARLAQRRLEARTLPSALRISAGVVIAWLLLVALPVSLNTGVPLAALAAALGVGALLFSTILLLGRRQLRLARRAEQRNLRLLEGDG